MFVRSSAKGAARMYVFRFDVLVTVTNVSPTLLWMMVPVGWWKTSTAFVIGRLALSRASSCDLHEVGERADQRRADHGRPMEAQVRPEQAKHPARLPFV